MRRFVGGKLNNNNQTPGDLLGSFGAAFVFRSQCFLFLPLKPRFREEVFSLPPSGGEGHGVHGPRCVFQSRSNGFQARR